MQHFVSEATVEQLNAIKKAIAEASRRAMEAGIDDVGGGVLFGLSDDWRYEILGLMLHNKHLEDTFGVGFHTISVPRMCPAEGNDLSGFHPIDDDTFLQNSSNP